jgi:hypothetical protein
MANATKATIAPRSFSSCFVIFSMSSVALVAVVLDLAGASSRASSAILGPLTYSGPGVVIVGWRWPEIFLKPFRLVAGLVRK